MDTSALPPPDAVTTASASQRTDAANAQATQVQAAANNDTNNGRSVTTVSPSTRKLIDIFV